MKTLSKLVIFSVLFMLSFSAMAQNDDWRNFSVSASLRTRGELRAGGMVTDEEKANPNDIAAFVTHRMRLPISFSHGIFTMQITPQHSGIWGDASRGNFNLYEAWSQLKSDKGLFLKIGRQALAYDDERIIGSDDWTMTAATHDVLQLGLDNSINKLHLTLAFNQNGEKLSGGTVYKDGCQPYKTMQVLWYHHDFSRQNLGLSLLAMNVGMQSNDTVDLHSEYQQLVGGYLSFSPRKTQIEASGYYQMGKNEYGIPISAWMASFKINQKLSQQWQITAGYDYLSGDPYYNVPPENMIGLPQHKVMNGFNTVYGSHHKFYGAMDFFYVSTYYGSFTPGLQNLYAGVHFNPENLKTFNWDFNYHLFAVATDLGSAGKPMDKILGHEIETVTSWQVLPYFNFSAGASFMFGTETLEHLKRTSSNHGLAWVWLSLNFAPTLFSKSWQ